MQVGIIGINHKSSPFLLREKLTLIFQKEFGNDQISNIILLSTCNRTELYFSSPHLAETHIILLERLKYRLEEYFKYALYSYFGRDCFYHLVRVISGLDSAIFGESDIQRQVKLAYEIRRKKHQLSHELHYLFQKGLKIGKDMRTSFIMKRTGAQLPHIIRSVMRSHKYEIKKSSILLVGNSDINRKLIAFFAWQGCKNMTLCTRMKPLKLLNTRIINWVDLIDWHTYDVVICGTYHNEYILKEVKDNPERTLLFDLSFPRNIHPNLGKHPNLSLYNIDQIGKIFQGKQDEKEILLCEDLIEKAVSQQIDLFKKRRQDKWKYANAYAF